VLTGLDIVVPLVPGIYPSIPARPWWRPVARSGPYLVDANPFVTALPPVEPKTMRWLASFVGCAHSIPVRQSLARLTDERILIRDNTEAFIRAVREGPDAERTFKQDFVDISAASGFILCPRGAGPSSIRLFEALEMGRAPVILSDDWQPPAGIDWTTCSVRVRERDVCHLPRILRDHESAAATLGQAARRIWEDHFGPRAVFDWVVGQATELLAIPRLTRAAAVTLGWCQLARPSHLRRLWRLAKSARSVFPRP
jgi:hypothetical protein